MSRPLNILQVTTFYPPYNIGGSGMYVYRLAHTLADAGHRVDVVHCIDSYNFVHPDGPQTGFAGHPNVHVHGLESGRGWLSPLLSHQTGRPVLKREAIESVIEETLPDVIHYHNISLLGADVLRLKTRSTRAIKIFTAHDHWLYCPAMTLWKFGSRLCDKPACVRCMLMAKRPPQLWRYTSLLRKSIAEVDAFVSPSRFTASMHLSHGFPYPVKYLPLVIDQTNVKEPTERPHPRPYFLFVGRLEFVKGAHTVIETWKRVPDFDLLIAGDGTELQKLQSLAAGNPKIKFLGRRSSGELAALYDHCVACIVPSIYYETSPTVVLEAFSRRAPVIARDLGGLTELIELSSGGILYRTEDELLFAIDRIAKSEFVREQLSSGGYRAYQQRWSREAQLRAYFDLLHTTAAAKFGYVPWEMDEAPQTLASAN